MAVSQTHWRFGTTEGTESTHGWHAAEDANPTKGVIATDTTFLLRVTEQADSSGASNYAATWQYRKNGGTWTSITTSTSNVKAVTPPTWSNNAACTKRLSGTGTFESSGAGCTADGTSGGTQNDIAADGNSETEIALQLVGANLADDDVIEFQIITASHSTYPTLTVAKTAAALVASVSTTTTVAAVFTAPQAINRDAGFPKVAHQTLGTGSSLATAAFDVPSGGRLLVALVGWMSSSSSDPGEPSITDNQGTHLNWTPVGTSLWTDANWPAYLRMWVADAPNAITGLTVTTNVASGGSRIGYLNVDCLQGTEPVASVLGAYAARQDTADSTAALAATISAQAAQSWVAAILATGNSSTALVADANTSRDDHQEDATVGGAIFSGFKTSLTSGAGNVTVGTTYGSNPYALWVVAELKHLVAQAAQFQAAVSTTTTVAAALTTAITLAAAVSGTTTVGAALTAGAEPAQFAADVQSTATVDAALTTSIRFIASIDGATTVTASLTVPAAGSGTLNLIGATGGNNSTATQFQITSVTVPAGSLVVVVAEFGQNANGDLVKPTIGAVTGLSSWSERAYITYTLSGYGQAIIWTATCASGISGQTITVTENQTDSKSAVVAAYRVGGYDSGTPVGAIYTHDSEASSELVNAPVTAQQSGSFLVGCFQGEAGSLTARSDTTQDGSTYTDNSTAAVAAAHLTNATTGSGSYTFGFTETDAYVLVAAVEIRTTPIIALQASVAGATTVEAALTTEIRLAASVDCGATISAALAGPALFAADVQCTTTIAAALTAPSSGLAAAVESGVTIYSYLEDVPPAISPASGVYASGRTVTISQSGGSGRTIRYTTDGSRPTASSTAYSGSFSVNSTGIVRAALFTSAGDDGPMATAWYAIESTGTKIGPDHVVRTDGDSKLISWLPQDIAYGEMIKRVTRALLTIPLDTDGGHAAGLPVFLFHSFMNADFTPAGNWASAPGGQIGMLLDSAVQAYPYTGNASLMAFAKMALMYLIKNGSTPATGSWQRAIYNEADPDEVPFIGAGDNGGGVGDGQGNLEPDKQAEIGWGALQLWKHDPTQTEFRDLAIRLADQLCANRKTSTSASVSPWPFRTTQSTNSRPSGAGAGEDYCSNLAPYIRLFDDLIALGIGSTSDYETARDAFWTWATTYPLSSDGDAGPWGHYFEDQPWSSVYTDDANNLNPNNMARLLLERPSLTSSYLTWAANLAAYVENAFGDTAQYGAIPINEQDWYMYPMGSHTSRAGMVRALLYAANSSSTDKDKAYRALNWTTYMNRTDGYSLDGYPSPNQIWMTDGFGDTIRHFAVAMFAVPEWAPAGEDHLLGSTSVVQRVRYHRNRVEYQTYDAAAYETLRLSFAPTAVSAGGTWLSERAELTAEGWVWDGTAKVLKIRHDNSGQIVVAVGATLAADVQCSTTIAATMVVPALLVAEVQATSTIAAALTTQIRFVAAVSGASTITGSLTTAITAQAGVSCTTTVAAALTTTIRFVSDVQSTTTVAAGLTTQIRPVAAVTTSSTVDAVLTTAIRFAAAIEAGTTVEANLMTGSGIAASVQSSATLSAALTTAIRFVAAAQGAATISAALTLPGAVLQAAVASSTTVSAALTAPGGFQAAVTAGASLSASLTTAIALGTSISTSTTISAVLTAGRLVGVKVAMLDVSTQGRLYSTSAKAALRDRAVRAELMNRST